MNVDEVLAKMDTLDTNEKEIQYIIDENLRIISIPPLGVVLGVEGDKDVNSAKFKIVRYYKGLDLSKFEIRINFANANGDLSYYTVKNLTVTDDTLTFEWLVGYLVTQYKGTVRFVVRMIMTDSSTGEVQHAFDTTVGEARSLEGLLVDVPTDEKVYDIVAQLKADLTDHVNNLLETIPKDYNELNRKVEDNTLGISKLNEGGLVLKDEIIEEDINNWLNEHPEATTTVQNKSITETKISNIFLPYIKNGYVTPEMFGAVGDGVADDSGAIEQTLSSNKNIIMKDGAIYKICRAIFPNATKIHIDGHGAKITADDTFSYTQNTCYGFFQFQVNAKNLTEFVVKNLDIDIKTNGILYGERTAGDERSCPIFRIKNTKIILIDNCNFAIMSNTGNRAILWTDGICDERVSITNSNFENKCAGNAGGVIAINMKNDLKDVTSFMANCSLITDSCDELYSIQNTGASNLYSTIESCVFINHGGFINNNSTKKTIIVATNHTGTGKLHMDISATKIAYDGQLTDLMSSVLKLSSYSQAHQNVVLKGCMISNPYGKAIEGAFAESGGPEYLHINAEKCDIVSGKSVLNDAIDSIGDIIITDCNIEGESYVSYFYPLNYTNRFVIKNSKVYLKNPIGILFVYNRKRHIVEICGNIYSGNYTSKAYKNDTIDPGAPDIDLEEIQNNVYVVQSTI
jgi:hypothetical protein